MLPQMWRQNHNHSTRTQTTHSQLLHQVFRNIHKTKANLHQELKELSHLEPPLALPHLSASLHSNKAPMFEDREEISKEERRNNHQKYKTVLTEQEEVNLTVMLPLHRIKGNPTRSQRLRSEEHTGRLPSSRRHPTRTHALKTHSNRNEEKEQQQSEGKMEVLSDRQKGKMEFLSLIGKIPHQIKLRTEPILSNLLHHLQLFNPFFNRTHPVVGLCLLKVGNILHKRNSVIYRLGEDSSSFFIILSGRVRLTNGPLKRICRTGETVLEETLFEGRLHRIALEKGKMLGEGWALQLSLQVMKRTGGEMVLHGYRLEWQQMQAVIKRNYIVKNWQRNRVRALQEI